MLFATQKGKWKTCSEDYTAFDNTLSIVLLPVKQQTCDAINIKHKLPETAGLLWKTLNVGKLAFVHIALSKLISYKSKSYLKLFIKIYIITFFLFLSFSAQLCFLKMTYNFLERENHNIILSLYLYVLTVNLGLVQVCSTSFEGRQRKEIRKRRIKRCITTYCPFHI